jgi:ferric-chelate reductase
MEGDTEDEARFLKVRKRNNIALTWAGRIRAAAASQPRPATPKNMFAKSVATVTAIFRESSYPQWTLVRNAFWLKVPPLGTILVLLAYLAFILALEFVNNDIPGAQHYTALGIRAAWLAVAQVPLLILLAGKNNLIGLITGVSYERLNVFHRWVARGFLLLATLHFGYQNYGWNKYGLLQLEWSTDTCPPTGIAAYALLLWINLSTVAPLRHLSYEFFVIQHLITFFGFIIAIMMHLPSTALYSRVYIYIPIALYLVDRIIRSVRWGSNNIRPGRATLLAIDDGGVTKIRVRNPHIKKWTPGAFVLLSIPQFGFAQSHPATIASIPTSHDGDLVFLLKSHGGFTKRILDSCSTLSLSHDPSTKPETTSSPAVQAKQKAYRAFIDGPYGASHANFASFDTVVLIAGSTGITFILPLLLDIAYRAAEQKQKLPVHRIEVIWMVKSSSCTTWVSEELQDAFNKLQEVGIEINIRVHVTCDERLTDSEDASRGKEEGCQCECDDSLGPCCCVSPVSDSDDDIATEKIAPSSKKDLSTSQSAKDLSPITTATITEKAPKKHRLESAAMLSGRPDFHSVLWELLDQAEGETGIAVCGPLGLGTAVRSAVVRISDQRAVHKGTGAQGIYLHVEGFCW